MLRHLLGQSSPGDDVDEVCATFALLVDEGAVDGQREAGHRLPAGDITQFGIAREPPDQDNPVQHDLSYASAGCDGPPDGAEGTGGAAGAAGSGSFPTALVVTARKTSSLTAARRLISAVFCGSTVRRVWTYTPPPRFPMAHDLPPLPPPPTASPLAPLSRAPSAT